MDMDTSARPSLSSYDKPTSYRAKVVHPIFSFLLGTAAPCFFETLYINNDQAIKKLTEYTRNMP
jgi:hypothetical protein